MEEIGCPVIKNGTYRYALNKKENRINKYYNSNFNNKRYGFELLRNDCGEYEIKMLLEWTNQWFMVSLSEKMKATKEKSPMTRNAIIL